MAKTIKTGKVEIDSNELKDENVSIRISLMLPLDLYKNLKVLALNEEHQGKYQVLMKDILSKYVEHHKPKKKKSKAS